MGEGQRNGPDAIQSVAFGPTQVGGVGYAPTMQGASARAEDAAIPRQVGRFVILRRVGAGGMGVVYAAYDEELSRKVAVKLLRASDPADGEGRVRSLREAQAMAQVSHPNVVAVYEVGEHEGQVFIAMEYVDGGTLRDWQRDPQRTREEILQMYLTVGAGLQAAHAADLVHRDFKPDNVLIGSDGRPRVADFGLARVGPLTQEPAQQEAAGRDSRESAALTVAGTIMGTPQYMSPEQHLGAATDAHSDQFSFCVALYEALYGRLPFAGETPAELALSVRGGVVHPLPSPSPIPALVGAALLRGLQVDPGARFPSMAELLAELALAPHQDRRMEPGTKLILVLGILALVVGTTLLSQMRWPARPVQVVRMYQVGIVEFATVLGMLMVLHRRLQHRPFHWGLLAGLLIPLAQMAVLRWAGMRAGLDLRWLLVFDLLAYSAGLANVALYFLPGVWFGVTLCGATAIALAILPGIAEYAQLAYVVSTLLSAALWIRTANRHGTRLPGGPSLRDRSSVRTSRADSPR